jgi:hypothetical protein
MKIGKKPKSKKAMEASMKKLIEGVFEMGWTFGIPTVGVSETVPGFIVGTSDYVDLITSHLPEKLFGGLSAKPTNLKSKKKKRA